MVTAGHPAAGQRAAVGRDSHPSRPTFVSGPLARMGQQRRASRVLWRPTLAVAVGMLCTTTAALLGGSEGWSAGARASAALIATLLLVLPTCLLESRTRCLVAVIPCMALLEPFTNWWGFSSIWTVAVLLAWWLRHRELQAVPAGLKQRQLAKQLERYPLLHHACLQLATTRNQDDVAQTLAQQAMRLGIGTLATAVHITLDKQAPTIRASQGIHPDGPRTSSQSDDEVIFVAREGRQLIRRRGAQMRMLFPLRETRGEQGPGGVLEVHCIHDASVDDYNAELQEALARMGGIALGTVDLLQQTRSLALRDSLTGLLGQQEFRRRGSELLSECARQGHPAALMVCDLDHLKVYNDTYGHLSGDRALIIVAHVLSHCLPEDELSDVLIGRWGGEEFVLLWAPCAYPQALAQAEAIRQRIAMSNLENNDPKRRITTSLGIARWQTGEAFDDLMRRADAACYAAKDRGRNCVVDAEHIATVQA